ncbi:hypothetical protein M3194_13610 [Paenibacillus glycanilyticus]|uniref:hypothetical protein n=1 Tax=Paenibacillus glycanilyticus TaxID=126569 RepID=UPI00203BB704|nr:hypothetical protein [Paenibacillus glycanilyticus]MCM3628401.1 hypothetical protein [Paenibacillus glycanilyticus]
MLRLFIEYLNQLLQVFSKYPSDSVLGLSDHPNVVPISYDFYFAYGMNPTNEDGEPHEWMV